MADKRKITVEVDDEALKKYSKEEQEALKQNTAKLKEEEARKTATVKAQLNERYANLKAALQKELIAVQGGKELVIKEAIAQRKVMESELRTYEATYRNILSKELAEFKATKQAELQAQRQFNQSITNAPRTNLKGAIGSEAYTRQIISAKSTMLPGSIEFAQSDALVKRYTTTLKQSGVEVKSLAQNIRGELTSALNTNAAAFIGVYGAQKLFSLSLDSAKFKVLRENFAGTTEDIENFRKATSGTVDDASLLKLSNQATDLGIDLKNQTILFSLAEDAADKYGTTVEEGFQKVVFATEGSTKGLKALGIQKAVYEETVNRLALTYGKEIGQLDAETQKQIRLQAIIEASGQTYEDVTNKVQDSADKHEQFIVIAKNLALTYGGDLFNAVTGVGTAYKMLNKLMNDGKKVWDDTTKAIQTEVIAVQDLLDKWGLLSKVAQTPIRLQVVVDGNIPSPKDMRGMLPEGANLEDAVRMYKNANNISWEEAYKKIREQYGFGTEPDANNPHKSATPSVSNGTSSQIQQEVEILNLIKLQEIAKEKLNKQYNENIGDVGAERDIRLEILNIEREIFRLKTGADVAFKGLGESRGIESNSLNLKDRYRNPLDLGNLNPRQQEIENLERSEKLTNAMLTGFEGMNNFVGSMLQKTGLMDTDFGKIVQMIQSIIGVGKEAFSFAGLIGDIISLFPGGSVIGGAVGGGARAGNFSMGGGGGSFAPTIVVNSEVERTKSVKFYGNTLPEYNRRQAVKTL